jgi:nucleoside 2-deoxyribosyltransferase
LKVYVASSWRNDAQPGIVEALRKAGHQVYDFRNPHQNGTGFHWSDISPQWESWTPETFIEGLEHPLARKGFDSDFQALDWADAVVMVMPCGRSAHLELGYAAGQKKTTVIMVTEAEPELMYKMATHLVTSTQQMLAALQNEQEIVPGG